MAWWFLAIAAAMAAKQTLAKSGELSAQNAQIRFQEASDNLAATEQEAQVARNLNQTLAKQNVFFAARGVNASQGSAAGLALATEDSAKRDFSIIKGRRDALQAQNDFVRKQLKHQRKMLPLFFADKTAANYANIYTLGAAGGFDGFKLGGGNPSGSPGQFTGRGDTTGKGGAGFSYTSFGGPR